MNMTDGVILLAATPIGNPDDASPRLRHWLEEADIVAAEDTRRLRGLCSRMGIEPKGQIVPVHDHNERLKADDLVGSALAGQVVLLVSDAGTPTVSDPGFRVVQAAVKANVRVSPLPGPSAALAALSVSGLPSDRFSFEGFLPRKSGEVTRRLAQVADDVRTTIWFESPKRLRATLRAMADVFGGDRQAVVCRELSKTYEEILRGTLQSLVVAVGEEPRGEITIVVQGAPAARDYRDYVSEVLKLAEEVGLKRAAAQVAEQRGVRKNDLYQAALAND